MRRIVNRKGKERAEVQVDRPHARQLAPQLVKDFARHDPAARELPGRDAAGDRRYDPRTHGEVDVLDVQQVTRLRLKLAADGHVEGEEMAKAGERRIPRIAVG